MSRWRRWWSLWSRSGMKMVKLRASSSQHGQVKHLCPHWIFIFWQNKCSDFGFQMCWIFWGQPWMRTTSLTLHCTTGWKLGCAHLKLISELFSGATTQGNFKRNLQKFKNREDVKVWITSKNLDPLFKLHFARFFLCQSAEVLMVSTLLKHHMCCW